LSKERKKKEIGRDYCLSFCILLTRRAELNTSFFLLHIVVKEDEEEEEERSK
jgi:hypothetical protein